MYSSRWFVAFVSIWAVFSLTLITDAQEKRRVSGRSQTTAGKEQPRPPKIGDVAKDFELTDENGKIVSLKQISSKHPTVLLVLRGWPGYQCPVCSRQVGDFLAKKMELEKADAHVILVYPGPANKLSDHAKEFVAHGKWEFPPNFHYVTDPEYKFTNDWGLRWEADRETAYPSTFVIGKDQKILWALTSTTHGGRAAAATVLEELAKLKSKE